MRRWKVIVSVTIEPKCSDSFAAQIENLCNKLSLNQVLRYSKFCGITCLQNLKYLSSNVWRPMIIVLNVYLCWKCIVIFRWKTICYFFLLPQWWVWQQMVWKSESNKMNKVWTTQKMKTKENKNVSGRGLWDNCYVHKHKH